MAINTRKWKRLQHFLNILSKHGFQEIVAAFGSTNQINTDNTPSNGSEIGLYQRIRLCLEELGPTFVKLGQAFSNREDILPKDLCIELQKLQDNVPVVEIDILSLLATELDIEPFDHFNHINTQPIAAASIAQVYTAQLKTGEDVVLKIKRPNILPVIEEDIMVIKMFGKFLKQHFAFAQKMHLYEGILSFETALIQELSFNQELQTLQTFQQCYKGQNEVHIPQTFPNYCSNEIVCMEQIKGAKITDIKFMQQHGIDKNKIAMRGLHTYLDQILTFGVFHADPHAGNIFIMADGRMAFIDFGTVGTIAQKDRLLLEDFILYLLTQNTSMLITTLKRLALEVKIENDKKFEQEIQEILDMIKDTKIDLVDPKIMLEKFKNLVHENEILLPPYIYLLVRGVMLLESIGRSIYPDMNLMKALQPYIYTIIKKRMHWRSWGPQVIGLAHDMTNMAQQLPKQIQQTFQNLENGNLKIKVVQSEQQERQQILQQNKIIWAILLGIVLIFSALLYRDHIVYSQFGLWILPLILVTVIVFAIYKIFFAKK